MKILRFTSAARRILNYSLFLLLFVTLLFIFSQNHCTNVIEGNSLNKVQLPGTEPGSKQLSDLTSREKKLKSEATTEGPWKLKEKNWTKEEKKKTNGFNTDQSDTSAVIDVKEEELFKNISKPKDSQYLFTVLPDEVYLKHNQSFFRERPGVSNDLDYPFFIKGENICEDNDIAMLIIIPSVATHLKMRNAIRKTWLGAGENNTWPGVNIKGVVKHIFLFGGVSGSVMKHFRHLKKESEIHKDIVMAAFHDSYSNLTTKGLVGLRWVLDHCSKAKVVLKVDEDTLINVPLMLGLLHHVKTKAGTDQFVLGLRHNYLKPIVVRTGKWGVTKEEYPLDFYPRYMYGHTYAISRAAAAVLVSMSKNVMYITPEDAFITGVLPICAGVTRLTAPSFAVCCRIIYDCEVVWNQHVAITTVDSPSAMENIWANIVTHTCNPNTPWTTFKD